MYEAQCKNENVGPHIKKLRLSLKSCSNVSHICFKLHRLLTIATPIS